MAETLNHPVPLGAAPVLSSGTRCPEGRPSPLPPGEPEFKAVVTQAAAALSLLLDQLRLHPTPPVRVAVALTAPVTGLALPPGVLCEEGSLPQEEMQAWARWAGWACGEGPGHVCTCICDSAVVCVSQRLLVFPWFVHHRPHEALAQDEALIALGKVLYLLDRILDGQVGPPGSQGRAGWYRTMLTCFFVPRILPRTAPRDRVQEHPSVPSRKFSWERGERDDL